LLRAELLILLILAGFTLIVKKTEVGCSYCRAIVETCVLGVEGKAAYPADVLFSITSAARRGHKEYAMSQSIAEAKQTPVEALDPEVLAFREQFEDRSTLDQIIRHGPRATQAW
jgi:hypothetical protein